MSLLLKLKDFKIITIGVLAFLLSCSLTYTFYIKNKLERKIYNLTIKLKDKSEMLRNCKSSVVSFEEARKNDETIISKLKKELTERENTCKIMLSNKDKLINKLQRLKVAKPKPTKEKVVIVREKCRIQIDKNPREDIIFNTISNIGN